MGRKNESRNENAKGSPLALIAGVSLCWAATFIFFYSDTFVPSDTFSFLERDLSRFCYLAGIVLGQALFLAPRHVIASESKNYLMIAGCGVLLVSVASQMAGIAYELNTGLMSFLMLFAGVWQGISHVLWGEMEAKADLSIALAFCVPVIAGAAIFSAVTYLGTWFAVVSLLICSCGSTMLFLVNSSERKDWTLKPAPLSPKRLPSFRKCDAICLVYGAVLGTSIYACLSFKMPAGLNYLIVGLSLICGAALVIALSRLNKGRESDFGRVATILLPFVSMALVLIVITPDDSSWAIYAALLALLTLFDVSSFEFFAESSRSLALPPYLCIARGRIAVQLGMLVAYLANMIVAHCFPATGRVAFIIPLVLIVCLSAMVAFGGGVSINLKPENLDEKKAQEDGLEASSEEKEDEPIDINRKKCQIAADHFCLSKREVEVLFLLTGGYSIQGIADKLVISTNTVKTHTSHIYRKMGVNSRQEVINLRDSIEEE